VWVKVEREAWQDMCAAARQRRGGTRSLFYAMRAVAPLIAAPRCLMPDRDMLRADAHGTSRLSLFYDGAAQKIEPMRVRVKCLRANDQRRDDTADAHVAIL